jgi:hypothetical protein
MSNQNEIIKKLDADLHATRQALANANEDARSLAVKAHEMGEWIDDLEGVLERLWRYSHEASASDTNDVLCAFGSIRAECSIIKRRARERKEYYGDQDKE